MNSYLPFIVIGVTSGSIYAIAATGLVLTYKTTGIFNFAHGAIAAGAAYFFYELHFQHGMSWALAAAISVGIFGPAFGLVLEFVARGLAAATPVFKLVATVGLLLAIEGLAVIIFGPAGRAFPQFLPTQTFKVTGVFVGYDQLIDVIVALASAALLYLFFRRTRLGIAMQGVVDSPDLLGLTGTSPTVVRRAAWSIGCAFAALSGLLLAPTIGLDPLLLTLLVVQAFGAAAIGAFASLPLTFVGGLVVGLGAAICTKFVAGSPSFQGLPPSVPFLVLFLALLLQPRGRLVEAGAQFTRRTATAVRSSKRARGLGLVAVAVAALAVPAFAGTRVPIYSTGLAYVLLFASLDMLVRTSGQISLCHIGFAAVGGAIFAHLAHDSPLPWLLALFVSGLITVPVGAVVAIPAIRLSGLYLALATFGFGILLERLVYTSSFMFGFAGNLVAPRPDDLLKATSDNAYYYVVLAVVAVCLALIVLAERSRLGRLLRALADSPLALSTQGTNINVTRTLVFCISAFFAGISGALLGPVTQSINGTSFASLNSLILLAVLAIFVIVMRTGPVRIAVMAALAYIVVPRYINNETFTEYLPVIFGLLAVLTSVASAGSPALRSWLARQADTVAWRSRRSPVTERLQGIRISELLAATRDQAIADGGQLR